MLTSSKARATLVESETRCKHVALTGEYRLRRNLIDLDERSWPKATTPVGSLHGTTNILGADLREGVREAFVIFD